jgi:hypothetical protein
VVPRPLHPKADVAARSAFKVNAETMSLFLATVTERHADEFIVMVMDRAGGHIAGDLVVPDNMRVVCLPLYSPELNPAEHLWDSPRENHFANTVSSSLDGVEVALVPGLRSMKSDLPRTQKLTGFKWITSISLNAG